MRMVQNMYAELISHLRLTLTRMVTMNGSKRNTKANYLQLLKSTCNYLRTLYNYL